jgi:hypothetical protein
MFTKTSFVCGQCGASREQKDVVVVHEDEVEIDSPSEIVLRHSCGFIGIRCKEHKNARKLARQSVYRHKKRMIEKFEKI